MHHIDFCSIYLFFFVLTCSLPLVFLSVLFGSTLCLCPYLSIIPKKTRAHRTPSTSSESLSRSELFRSDKSRELYEKLNSKRKIWVERSVMLDELHPAIKANFESRG